MKKLISSIVAISCVFGMCMPTQVFNYEILENQSDSSITANASDKSFSTYELTDEQLTTIAAVCFRESGNLEGASKIASLAANRYELYGKAYDSVYDYIINSHWFAITSPKTDSITEEAVTAIKDVLVYGKRTLPKFIDEVCYINDISYVANNNNKFDVSNRFSYIPFTTLIKTVYVNTCTYYSHLSDVDVFAYSDDSLVNADNDYYYDYTTGIFMSDESNVPFTKYALTDEQLSNLAYVCYRENGNAKGAAAEASMMANRFELYGSKFNSLYDYVTTSRWWALPKSFSTPPDDVLEACRNVFVNGKRTLPFYVTERDASIDVKSATNDEVSIDIMDKAAYVPFTTVITNVYGGSYTFYDFPTNTSDAYGYKKQEEPLLDTWNFYYDFDTNEITTVTQQVQEQSSKRGDANGDGKVDIIDIITINKTVLGKETMLDEAVDRIDTNENGVPDSVDSLTIMKFIVGMIDSLD